MKEREVFHIHQTNYNSSNIAKKLKKTGVFQGIKGNMKVLLKPNFILASHKYNSTWVQIITNGEILYAITEILVDKLNDGGKIIIADGPDFGADINKIKELTNINKIKDLCHRNGIEFKFIDLRDFYRKMVGEIEVRKKALQGDPKGSILFNLMGRNSEFYQHKRVEKQDKQYWGANTDIDEVNRAHNGYDNLYKLSKSVFDADVFINIPKLKTHKKTGITCSLKNLVGINTFRNYLPHYTLGYPENGGDQFPKKNNKNELEYKVATFVKTKLLPIPILNLIFIPLKKLARLYFGDTREVIRSGNWFGNDTIWRMVLDLNKLILYGNKKGKLHENKIRKYITIVDGIIAGEGKGPMAADKTKANSIIAGTNPLAVDCFCAKLMGFDYKKIPMLNKAFEIDTFPIANFKYDDILITSDKSKYNKKITEINKNEVLSFEPHFGWKGEIEL